MANPTHTNHSASKFTVLNSAPEETKPFPPLEVWACNCENCQEARRFERRNDPPNRAEGDARPEYPTGRPTSKWDSEGNLS